AGANKQVPGGGDVPTLLQQQKHCTVHTHTPTPFHHSFPQGKRKSVSYTTHSMSPVSDMCAHTHAHTHIHTLFLSLSVCLSLCRIHTRAHTHTHTHTHT